ncbi:hypothetical protein TNCV_1741781, partial [Trichonephila clavipes]
DDERQRKMMINCLSVEMIPADFLEDIFIIESWVLFLAIAYCFEVGILQRKFEIVRWTVYLIDCNMWDLYCTHVVHTDCCEAKEQEKSSYDCK